MEKIRRFYKTDGLFYTMHRLKSISYLGKKLKKIDIYRHYVSTNFNKSISTFNNLIEHNHNLEMKKNLTNFYDIISRIKLNLLLRLNESDIVNAIFNQKQTDILNKNLIHLCKYSHILEKKFVDRKMRKTFNNFILQAAPKLDLITLMTIFSSNFFDQKNYGNDLLLIIEEKLEALKAQNKSTADRYLDNNIKDNSIIFCLIDIINNCIMNELVWEFFTSVIERRIVHLNLAEAITCTIFFLENRIIDSYILNALSMRIVQICNSNNIYLDFKSYEIIFQNLPLLKILLDFNKLSFDYNTEMIIEELFCKFLHLNQKELDSESSLNDNSESEINLNNNFNNSTDANNNKRSKGKKGVNTKNKDNKIENNFQIQEINEEAEKNLKKFHYINLQNSFFSNTSIILSKRDYTEKDIEFFLSNFCNEIYDEHYFKRLNLKKNPYDLFLMIKLIAKNPDLVKAMQENLLSKVIDKAINCFFTLEKQLQNRLFFMLNISLSKDCIFILKNLNSADNSIDIKKKNILNKMIKIIYKKFTELYFQIKEILFLKLDESVKNLEEEIDKEEMKNYFTTIAMQFFEMFSLDKENEKYIYYKDLVMEDLKNLVSMDIYNKKDLKQFVTMLKKDNLICDDFKNNLIKTNNYYF